MYRRHPRSYWWVQMGRLGRWNPKFPSHWLHSLGQISSLLSVKWAQWEQPHWAVCGAGWLEGAEKAPNTVPGPTEVPTTRWPLLRQYPQEARDGGLRARECFSWPHFTEESKAQRAKWPPYLLSSVISTVVSNDILTSHNDYKWLVHFPNSSAIWS